MVKVAVAGGLGHVGRTIVEVLKDDRKHDVIILSRKASEDSLAPVVVVDYEDVDSTTEVLESNGVDAVICALSIMSEAAGKSQISLIKAAAKSAPTKKFVASIYGVPHEPEDVVLMPHVQWRLAACEELKKAGLQWTQFMNGYFLDYYGLPYVKSHQTPVPLAIDVANKVAGIPGAGNTPVTFTYTFDVAKFIAASLDLPEWAEETFVIGDTLTWNELLKLAEVARGSKFEVHYDDLDKLKTFQITELPSHIPSYSLYPKEQLQYVFAIHGQWMDAGRFNLPADKALNNRFPEIATVKAKDLLDQAWKGK